MENCGHASTQNPISVYSSAIDAGPRTSSGNLNAFDDLVLGSSTCFFSDDVSLVLTLQTTLLVVWGQPFGTLCHHHYHHHHHHMNIYAFYISQPATLSYSSQTLEQFEQWLATSLFVWMFVAMVRILVTELCYMFLSKMLVYYYHHFFVSFLPSVGVLEGRKN